MRRMLLIEKEKSSFLWHLA
ncbi:hypothetical protein SAMN03159485_03564 [Pseudomonas sp. NFPP24]|nr:hypothetical protein SAMN03159485_03564 [Pseudomonas sp. NFPP24]